jgi:pimeloyl-ACP methyl ester carboxylesterase
LRLHPRGLVRALVALTAMTAALVLTVPVRADTLPATCSDQYFPVTLTGLPETLYGQLCVPAGGAKTVAVLVPGASYDSAYWNSPYDPSQLSFVDAMNNAGYATLDIDRLGTGRSSHPLSALLTSITQAATVHQVIQDLRTGSRTQPFASVLLGGHSVGSAISIIEAGTYHDVNGVLVTGLSHGINPIGAVKIVSTLIPADLDSKFASLGLDPGYLTTDPGTRYNSFQAPGPYIASIANMDEATKDVFAPGEVVDTVLIGVVSTYSKLINVPTMLVMGQDDPAFCGGLVAPNCSSAASLLADEGPYYSAAAQLHTYVVDDWGHSINYAPDAPGYQTAVIAWAKQMIN